MWLTYEQGTRSAVVAAGQQMGLLSRRVTDHYRAIFRDGVSVVALTSAVTAFRAAPPADMDAKAAFLAKALTSSDHLDGLYVGYPSGAFVHAVSLARNPAWGKVLSAPEGTRYAIRTIESLAAGRRSTWRFYGPDGSEKGDRAAEAVAYDPRVRPWYTAAARQGAPITVGPYAMATTGKLGLTVAAALEGDRSVVVGADVLLETISHLLSREAISPKAVGYVFDATGRLIVHSDDRVMERVLERLKATGDRTTGGRAADDLGDPMLGAVRKLLAAQRPADVVTFDVGGRSHLARITTITGIGAGGEQTVVIAAPLGDFTGPSEALLQKLMVFSALLIGIGILSALVVARLISRSLTALAEEARQLGELEFGAVPVRHSRVAEINTLAGALASARAAIQSFALYVPRELVRKVIATRQQTAGNAVRRDVTVLFTDIRDFTTVSEQRSPEEVVGLLSAYFERFNAIVERHNGVIVQYLGDAIFAMWNAPEANPRHVDDACRCALALAADVEALNAANRAVELPELVTRFGLHTGVAFVGSVGAKTRQQYTAMGDTVNVASRLEGMNKEFGTSILASGAVRESAGTGFGFRPLGPRHLKGRAEPIEIFELTGTED